MDDFDAVSARERVGQAAGAVKEPTVGRGRAPKLEPRLVYEGRVDEVVRVQLHAAGVVIDEQVRLSFGIDGAVLMKREVCTHIRAYCKHRRTNQNMSNN